MVEGFDEVVIESGLLGTPPILILIVPRYRNNAGVLAALFPSQPAGALITVHAREADVEQDEFGPVLLNGPPPL
jgi:hypothetical protein